MSGAILIDLYAILWDINWLTKGTVLDFSDHFINYYVSDKTKTSHVYLVFVGYSATASKVEHAFNELVIFWLY